MKFYQCKSTISINDIDINEIVVSNKFPFGKQDFKYFIVYKDNKEIRPLAYSFQKWVCKNKIGIIKWVYKGYSDKTKCMYFMIKDEKRNW